VSGGVPPWAASGKMYADPTLPSGSVEGVVIVGGPFTVRVKTCESACGLELELSATEMKNENVPAWFGTPVRLPLASINSPPGVALRRLATDGRTLEAAFIVPPGLGNEAVPALPPRMSIPKYQV